MSDLVNTVLQNYRSDYQGRLDKHVDRPSEYGIYNMFQAQNQSPMNILTDQDRNLIRNSFNVDVQIPVLNTQSVTVTNARTCAFQTEGADSALITVSMATYATGFVARPIQHFENQISYQQQINKLIAARMDRIAKALDGAAQAALEANLNIFWPAGVTAFYPQVGNALQVPQADKNDFYNQLQSILSTMDYSGGVSIGTNHIGMGPVRRLAAQGEGNAVNEGFQLLGYTWYPSNRVANSAGTVESTLYAVAPGSIAVESRISPEARMGMRIHESQFWTRFPNAPLIGRDMDVYYQANCQDISAIQASGLANSTQTKVESWQFAIDVGFVTAYVPNPATEHAPIVKAEILA